MNTQVHFVKSFSKGQITIPKGLRDAFGIGDDFWLKLSVNHGRIIAEPVKEEPRLSQSAWKEKLLKMGVWDLTNEIKEIRQK